MTGKIKLKLGEIQETLLLPLWGRAVESKKSNPRLVDQKALEIIESIDYDFSIIESNISWVSQLAWVARSLHIDGAIAHFQQRHPAATVVNLGCGLDTTFERVDNGRLKFFDLDFPDVINLRKMFFTETERRRTISSSLLDTHWFDQLDRGGGLMFIAAGVFYYIDEIQMKHFLVSVADAFPGCELFFDSASPLGVNVANKKVIKDGGMNEKALLKWGVKSAKVVEKWDRRIRLVGEFPMFRGFKKGYSFKMKYGLMISDILNIMSMVHLRIQN